MNGPVVVSFKLWPEEFRAIDAAAKAANCTRSDLLRSTLRQALGFPDPSPFRANYCARELGQYAYRESHYNKQS